MPSQNCWKVLNEYLWQLHEKQQNYGELSVTQDNANDQVIQCIMSQCSVSNGAKTWLAFNSLYMILHIPHIHFFYFDNYLDWKNSVFPVYTWSKCLFSPFTFCFPWSYVESLETTILVSWEWQTQTRQSRHTTNWCLQHRFVLQK